VFVRFLKLIGTAVPDGLELHLIRDKHAPQDPGDQEVAAAPGSTCTSPPTNSSRINLVERWFAQLTNRKLRRSAHRSVTDWKPTSASGSAPGTKGPRPYVWTKTADEILDTRATYCRQIPLTRDPANSGIFLLIDQSDQPKANALADWRQQAANRQGTYPGYHLILLQPVRYPQAEQAADWEFTYNRNGVTVQVLNRNILANARHAYALYWSTPASDWNAYYHFFQVFAATFRPAPAGQPG
jgi:hypothetical protein